MRVHRGSVSAAVFVTWLLGCGASPALVEAPPALVVRNHSAHQLRVAANACGSADQPTYLHAAPLEPGQSVRIPLHAGCYDFDALRADGGQTVGRQHGVELRRPMDWTIAR